MWASAPDAFECFKKDKLLLKYSRKARASPEGRLLSVNDPDGFFTGFRRLRLRHHVQRRAICARTTSRRRRNGRPQEPVYFGHVAFRRRRAPAPPHLTVETILQGEGWDKGWATLLEIGGQPDAGLDRSFGVPDAVNSGQYGVGIVIDFFGLSGQGVGLPGRISSIRRDTIVPANVASSVNAKNQKAAEAFVELLLSEEGQQILLDPKIQRLPVRLAPTTRRRRLSQSVQGRLDRLPRSASMPRLSEAAMSSQLAQRPCGDVPPQ